MKAGKLAAAFALALLLGCTTLVGVADAAHVTCGQVITEDTTLDADLGPCPGDGIVIGADNITLDLGGHRVLGSPSPGSAQTGIVIDSRSGVRVRNGTVSGFDTGVALLRASGNTVERLVIRDNRCSGVLLAQASSDNVIRANRIERNGCAGVVISGATRTLTEANRIIGNAGPGVLIGAGSISFRTGPNTTSGNLIASNSGDGVFLANLTVAQTIVRNAIVRNGENGVRIQAYSTSNTVQGNFIAGNSLNGVVIERDPSFNHSNQILQNTAVGNGSFDLADLNPACGGGTWAGNRFRTRNQPCIN